MTLSDSRGRFELPALPPGSYTLRAASAGHEPSASRRVTVLPNREAFFTVSLAPAPEKGHDAGAASGGEHNQDGLREWLWLLRHKRRSVLESATAVPTDGRVADSRPGAQPTRRVADFGALAGTLEVATEAAPTTVAERGVGAVRLTGQLMSGVRWNLNGRASDDEGGAWHMAARFVIDPGAQQEIEAGAGYGMADGRTEFVGRGTPLDRTTATVFAKDRWQLGDRVKATAGARYTHLGFLATAHHADAAVAIEVQGPLQLVLHGSAATRSLAPGGELLTSSTVISGPAGAGARLQDGLRPARSTRYEMGVARAVGAGQVGAELFVERASDPLRTTFDQGVALVRNGSRSDAAGLAVSAAHRIGSLNGSMTYTFGRGRPGDPLLRSTAPGGGEPSLFHDLVAQIETAIDSTDTRVTAVCRVNRTVEGEYDRQPRPALTRFEVHVTQGLPFLQPLTRAEWALLLAVRNMFHEVSQGDFLEELSVERPPTWVVGGVSVRF